MSDSSSSGSSNSSSSKSSRSSKPSFHSKKAAAPTKKSATVKKSAAPTKRKAKSISSSSNSSGSAKTAKSAKSTRSVKSVAAKSIAAKNNGAPKKNAPRVPVNFSKLAPKLGIKRNSPETTRKLMKRLTETQAKVLARKIDKEVEEAVYKKLTRKAKRSLNTKDKRLIAAVATNAANSGSRGSVNVARLVGHLKTAPTYLANVAKAGTKFQKGYEKRRDKQSKANALKAYEARQAFVKAEEEKLKDRLKAAKDAITAEAERVPEGPKKLSSKEISDLCRLRAHGFNITVKDHLVLREHLENEETARISRRLVEESEGRNACAICDLEHYLINM